MIAHWASGVATRGVLSNSCKMLLEYPVVEDIAPVDTVAGVNGIRNVDGILVTKY